MPSKSSRELSDLFHWANLDIHLMNQVKLIHANGRPFTIDETIACAFREQIKNKGYVRELLSNASQVISILEYLNKPPVTTHGEVDDLGRKAVVEFLCIEGVFEELLSSRYVKNSNSIIPLIRDLEFDHIVDILSAPRALSSLLFHGYQAELEDIVSEMSDQNIENLEFRQDVRDVFHQYDFIRPLTPRRHRDLY